ncbi:hypothetical protein FWK35_00014419 [Aphis craccivora]|uniref:Uncharacterized protein n=1 Tax=Aphis craccivora TaxID=307492 RepID=A0A6G0YP17_APHCR|nr:hypothetical protein FWK35_00014419 [Aphis craccivora]
MLVCLVWDWFVSRYCISWLVGWGEFVGWSWATVWDLVSSFDFLDDCVKTAVVIGCIFNDAGRTIGFQKAVRSFDVATTVT